MPWRETCAMRERLKFVALVEAGEETMAELCRRFGISRKTGYKFMERFAAQGIAGLCERSHAPHQHPHAVCEEIEQRVVELRGEHPFWGPRKLRARLRMLDGAVAWPAASTIGDSPQATTIGIIHNVPAIISSGWLRNAEETSRCTSQ